MIMTTTPPHDINVMVLAFLMTVVILSYPIVHVERGVRRKGKLQRKGTKERYKGKEKGEDGVQQ
jgi:hypothetical protein